MELKNIIAQRPNKTIYRDGDRAVKVFEKGYSKADILNEALNQARIEENTDLLIPKILEVSTFDGRWAIVSEFIEGKTLDSMMKENPDRIDEYMERFVKLQLEVQSKRVPQLTQLKDKMNAKISKTDLDATARYDLHMRLEGMKTHNKVCHGDFNPSNVIITPDDKAYILDWAHVTQGNGSADAARTYLVFKLEGRDDEAEKYLRCYCRLADVARQYINEWLPIVAASQSVKGKPEEKEFLAGWIGVVDYV
ncbi:MAG: phosphotransferase family protein [Oscillospiraceae bacterium]|jgi:aminoglycoside phosphotransferase (APT) family kinase protein